MTFARGNQNNESPGIMCDANIFKMHKYNHRQCTCRFIHDKILYIRCFTQYSMLKIRDKVIATDRCSVAIVLVNRLGGLSLPRNSVNW